MSDANWFVMLARAARDIVDDLGGAAIMTRDGWIEAVKEVNIGLKHCPARVLEHFTTPLPPRQGLATRAYRETCPQVVMVFDPKTHADAELAREHCERSGLPDAVMIALTEAGAELPEGVLVVA